MDLDRHRMPRRPRLMSDTVQFFVGATVVIGGLVWLLKCASPALAMALSLEIDPSHSAQLVYVTRQEATGLRCRRTVCDRGLS
jgi:hypothetical protein